MLIIYCMFAKAEIVMWYLIKYSKHWSLWDLIRVQAHCRLGWCVDVAHWRMWPHYTARPTKMTKWVITTQSRWLLGTNRLCLNLADCELFAWSFHDRPLILHLKLNIQKFFVLVVVGEWRIMVRQQLLGVLMGWCGPGGGFSKPYPVEKYTYGPF